MAVRGQMCAGRKEAVRRHDALSEPDVRKVSAGLHCGNTSKLTCPLSSYRAPGWSSRTKPSPEVNPDRPGSELWALRTREPVRAQGKSPPGQEGESAQEGISEGSWVLGEQGAAHGCQREIGRQRG